MRSGGNNFNYFSEKQTHQIGKFNGVFKRMICFVWATGGLGPLGPSLLATPWRQTQVEIGHTPFARRDTKCCTTALLYTEPQSMQENRNQNYQQ